MDQHISSRIKTVKDPKDVGDSLEEFLHRLGGPSWIKIKGSDPNRLRVVVTLLHGNESSGVKAIHRWLQRQQMPVTNLYLFIGAVEAATHREFFQYRHLDGKKDLNRCFNAPYEDDEGHLAQALLQDLMDWQPESILDLHNTSSNSLPFAVTYQDTPTIRQLTRLCTSNLMIMKRRLGTLVEQATPELPILTIEFGRSSDPRSDHLAMDLVEKLATWPSLFKLSPSNLRILTDPLRLELQPGVDVTYADNPDPKYRVTILHRIDTYNFLELRPDTLIGWVNGDPQDALKVNAENATDRLQDLFKFEGGRIKTKKPMTLSMATTDSKIAAEDCLLYVVEKVTNFD